MKDLGASNSLGNSEALSINSRRQTVGYSFNCDFYVVDASLWEKGSVVDLNKLISPPPDLYLSTATYINDRGEITVLGSLPNGDQHAVLLIQCDENHLDIEVCDYSMVDASEVAAQRPVTIAAPRSPRSMLSAALPRQGNRFRLPRESNSGPAESEMSDENQILDLHCGDRTLCGASGQSLTTWCSLPCRRQDCGPIRARFGWRRLFETSPNDFVKSKGG